MRWSTRSVGPRGAERGAGALPAVTRQGRLSLFTAALLVSDSAVLPLLAFASLPAWLLVTGRPQMQLHADGTPLR
jgi:hypothetical protein